MNGLACLLTDWLAGWLAGWLTTDRGTLPICCSRKQTKHAAPRPFVLPSCLSLRLRSLRISPRSPGQQQQRQQHRRERAGRRRRWRCPELPSAGSDTKTTTNRYSIYGGSEPTRSREDSPNSLTDPCSCSYQDSDLLSSILLPAECVQTFHWIRTLDPLWVSQSTMFRTHNEVRMYYFKYLSLGFSVDR